MNSKVKDIDKNLNLDILKWRSRRGMLELDLLLIDFIDKNYEKLDSNELLQYCNLLEENDTDLYSWFIDNVEVPNKELVGIINKIKKYSLSKV